MVLTAGRGGRTGHDDDDSDEDDGHRNTDDEDEGSEDQFPSLLYSSPILSDLRIQRKTGAGKSLPLNIILRQEVFETHLSSESVTEECQQYQQKVEDRKISVIDTSGLCDSSVNEEQLKEERVKCDEMSVLGPRGLLDEKYKDEEQTVKCIQENFGEEAAHHTINVFTEGDQLNNPTEKSMTTDDQINEAGKVRFNVFSDTDVENRSQVTEMLEKTDKMLEEDKGQHFTNEMYQEVQRRKALSLAQKTAFVGAGVLGGAIGVAGAVVGGVAHGAIGLVAPPVALIAAGVALMAEGGSLTIEQALKACKEQKGNEGNNA
ncbi:GTPase IMAP family member 7-like [Carassius gibelio]|uniref:GTPase IMAP family member 7-like n=1 Tax=Carassius gibelio TaxID=101364 RepID=UPI002277E31A|nr:GTPase IMAP family member 7-like [Carassius gibelio]